MATTPRGLSRGVNGVVAVGPVVLRHRTSGAAACLLLVVVTVAMLFFARRAQVS